MSDRLHEAVRAAFPGRVVDAIEKQSTRPGNETGLVTFTDAEPVYIKTATDTDRRLVRETAATRYAGSHCPIGTPTVVAADPYAESPYLTTEPLAGEILNDQWVADDDRTQLLKQTGRILAGVHEPQFDDSGVITGGDEDGLELTTGTWGDVLSATIEWRATDWFPDRFDDLPQRVIMTIREIKPELNGVTPTLLHTDCSRTNVHLSPNGLLDWERSVVGDPALDLVNTTGSFVDQPDVEAEDQAELTDALYAGYRQQAGELPEGMSRRRPLYWVIWYLLTPQTFDVWAPSVDVPNDELAAEVREEFDSRLSRARDMAS